MRAARANLGLALGLALLLLPTLLSSPLPVGTDAYYHIRFAEMLARDGFPESFPWVTQSVLGERFADTAPGFHLLLVPFTWMPESLGGLLGGAKLEAYLAALGVYVLLGAFLRSRGVPSPWLWTLVLVAVGGSLWRYCMPRPHTLSVMMMILYLRALDAERRRWLVGVVAAAWWSLYVGAPQLAIGIALVDLVVRWRRDERPSLVPLAATLVGLGVAALAHPNFPRSLPVFWIQTVEIPLADWLEGEAIRRPTEMEPYSPGMLVANTLAAWLAVGAVALATAGSGRPWSRSSVLLVALALLATPFFLLSQRFVEYWAPLVVMACAFRWADRFGMAGQREGEGEGEASPAGRAPLRVLRVGVAVLAVASSLGVAVSIVRQPGLDRERMATEWLDANTPAGSIVFTANWSDFPRLFYFSRHNRYLVHMDPIFLRKHDRAAWEAWNAIRFGDVAAPSRRVEEVFGARAIFVTEEFPGLHGQARADLGLEAVLPELYVRRRE